MESTVRWRYRVKLIEKLFYILLLSLAFIVYKSPAMLSMFLYDYPLLTITSFSGAIIGFSVVGFYLDKRSRKNEQLAKKLKEQLKDTKRMLVSQMDPQFVQVFKEIVKGDMKDEIEQMRNSDQGCSEKCKLTMDMHKLDVERNNVLVEELINFNWCD